MKLPNKLPELEHYLVSGSTTVHYLQKIIKYDGGLTESSIIGVWDSPNGDIDKAAQNVIRQEKEFCEYNKFVKPHTFTIRKIKTIISEEVIESQSEHYGITHKFKSLELPRRSFRFKEKWRFSCGIFWKSTQRKKVILWIEGKRKRFI